MRARSRVSSLALLVAGVASILPLSTSAQGPSAPSAPSPATTTSAPAAPAGAATAASAPATSPETPVLITSPRADAFISGNTVLRAAIDPSVSAQAVQFFVDGRQFCS